MSIIIHFNTASFIPSSVKLPSAPSIIKAKAKLAMVPGIDQTDRAVMTDDESSMVDIATSNTLYTHTVNDLKTNHVLGSCFGLPYQDHNYGAPPPPTPPSYSPCASPAHANGVPDEDTNLSIVSTSTSTANEGTQGASITRCICGFEHDDEYMICCDHCLVWQHVDCMGLDRNNIPDTYLCEKCQPRKVDRHKAKVLQTRKKVAMTDSSETDDDHEVKNSEKKTRMRCKRRRKEEEKTDKHDHASSRRSRNMQKHKERIEAKRSKLRRTKNKESTSTADEEAQDAWEISLDWCEKNFETAVTNQYTPEVQHLARTLPLQGHERRFMELLLTRHCEILDGNLKRLISIYDIPRDQPLIQYVGKFLLASQFYELHPAFSKRLFPFVMFYTLGQEEICVDASVYGNEARFVRRSCKPNAELRHLVYNGNLHLYISSTKAVFKDDEITLPFDFSLKESLKDVECACESEDCILKFHPKNGNIDIGSHEKRKRGRKLTLSADDDSSHSFLGSSASPSKSKHGKSTSQTSEHTDGKSENESEEQANERKKKTREERKIDAIMRAFDQMEKAAKRRQQALEKHKTHHPKSEESLDKTETSIAIKEEEKVATASGSETQGGEEEKVHIPAPKPKKGKRRRGSGSALSRRRTRTNSGGSDILSPEENLQIKSEPTTITAGTDVSYVESNTEILNVTTACSTATIIDTVVTTAISSTPVPSPVLKTKRFLLHEWLQEKSEANTNALPTSPVTVRSEVKWNAAATSTCYSQCTKYNPHSGGISAAHLRRSSTSGQIKSFPIKSCSEQGSAKKRWLRQAMYDCNSYEDPLSIDTSGMDGLNMENGYFSPNGHGEMCSPGASDDTVTPLKKRRLMRESLDSTSSPLSPTMHNPDSICSILSPVNEEVKTEHRFENIEQQLLMSSKANSCSDLSPSKSKEETPNYDLKSECDENYSKLCIKEKNCTLVTRASPESKPFTETSDTSGKSSNCTGIEPSMQIKCDLPMKINCDSTQTVNIPSSNNLDSSHNVSTNCVLSSDFDKHSVQLCSDKSMQSNLQTHPNNIPIKVQNVSNESTTQNSSVKRKIVFPGEEQCCTLLSSTSEVNTSSIVSDFSELKNTVSTSDVEMPSPDAGVEHSPSTCENLPKENVNKILNNSNISILSVNSESTTKDNSPDPSPMYPEMHISPVNNLNVSVTVETPKTCLTDVRISEPEVLSCNSISSNHVNSNNEKPEKFSELDFKFSHMSSESSGVAEKRTCASATQKRKVSLSEYRKRIKDGINKRSSCEIIKESSATAIPGTLPEPMTLAPLPLFDISASSKSPSPPTPVKTQKKKKDPIKIEEPDDIIEHRENLTERLKREFGFDEDSGGCIITSTTNKFSNSGESSTLPVSAQPPPPPPPPPPPRPVRVTKSNIGVNAPTASPSQFGFPVPTHYARPSYIVPQVPSTQFIPVQQAVTAPVMPSMHPITPPVVQCNVQPSLLPLPHSYSPSLPRSILRPSMQQHEYSSVNAQNYAALVQQPPPPPPPKSYNHVYQPGLYK